MEQTIVQITAEISSGTFVLIAEKKRISLIMTLFVPLVIESFGEVQDGS